MDSADNPQAFPNTGIFYAKGMTLRDWFAGQAIAQLADAYATSDRAAQKAYAIADAMLAERQKRGDA